MNEKSKYTGADAEFAIMTLETIFRGAAQLTQALRSQDRTSALAATTHYLEMTAALMHHTKRMVETTTQRDIAEQGAAILSLLAEAAARLACGKLC